MPTIRSEGDRRRERQTREYADQIAGLRNQIEDIDQRIVAAEFGQISGPVFRIRRGEGGWAVGSEGGT